MFWHLVKKELLAIIKSPKFVAAFGTISFLILLSVSIGIYDYKLKVEQYNTAEQLTKEQVSQSTSWHSVSSKIYRKPNPMLIFTSGVNNDIGRFSYVDSQNEVKLQNSSYSDNPLFAIFRFLDFTFIVTVVFSLFAILFTYNSINGEKEGGTLKLVFANSISRIQYIGAKFFGMWAALVLPALIPILISFLLIINYDVEMGYSGWEQLSMLVLVSVIYFSFFICFGILVSALTKYSPVSFLSLLVCWIVFVFIIPRVGVMAAGQMVQIASQAQIDSQLDAYSKDAWNAHSMAIGKRWEKRNTLMEGMNEAEREQFRDENGWGWMMEDDKERKAVQKQIAEHAKKLNEEYRNSKIQLKELALTLSRISPASSYQLAAMNLAATDIGSKNRYETSIDEYRNEFLSYVEKKQEESGGMGGLMISIDSEKGIDIKDGRKESSLDTSELPKYSEPEITIRQIMTAVVPDIGLLALFTLAALAYSFIAFLRYDLR
jgi:ABC-type transport system involved in multi-copper enzyme maturation permease subunit